MFRLSYLWLLMCMSAWPLTQAAEPAEVQTLIAQIQSNATHQEKLTACQRLALVGTKEAVPALAAMLTDTRLSHPARIALETIPDAAAAEALRNALPKLKGPQLIGVIHSIGMRRDIQATTSLRGLLAGAESQAACAAATALGRIGSPEAAQILTASLASTQGPVREAVADASLRCAESLAAQNNRQASQAVYDALRKTDVPERLRAAALRGAILGRPPVGDGLLAEGITSPSPMLFAMALRVGREVRDPAVTQVLLAQLMSLTPDRQAAVIRVLGDRADKAARPAVINALKHPAPEVRLAAVEALATLAEASTIDALLVAAVDANPEIAAKACDSLTAMNGEGVDAALVERAGKAQGPSRLVVLEVVGRRHLRAAVPALISLADAADTQPRQAAIIALGRIVPLDQLSMLIKRFSAPSHPEDAATTETALREACRRMADKPACAEMLVRQQIQGSTAEKCIVYELLGELGGSEALKAVVDGAKDPDEKARDVATRVLGDWPTPDAAEPLLTLAKTLAEPRYRVRALRGYLRIARQMDVGDGKRLQMSREALAVAERDEERALALDALSRVPSVQALELVVPHLKTQKLKVPASVAALNIAEKLTPDRLPKAVEPMKLVLQATNDQNLARRANEVLQRAEAAAQR